MTRAPQIVPRVPFFTSDEKRFLALYEQYHRLVRSVLFNLAGDRALDDLTQEVFLKAWKGLPKFGRRAAEKTWLYRITVNTAIDYLRQGQWRVTDGVDMDTFESDEASPLSGARKIVHEAVRGLEEDHRIVVTLHYFEELSLEEMASVLDIPLGTVKSRLFHARQKLSTDLKGKGVEL